MYPQVGVAQWVVLQLEAPLLPIHMGCHRLLLLLGTQRLHHSCCLFPLGHLHLQVSFKPNSGDSSQSWRRPMSQTNHETPRQLHTHSRKCPKSAGYLEVFDEAGNKRAISPTGRDPQTQLDALNASFVPKGWMMIPQSGKVHRLYF